MAVPRTRSSTRAPKLLVKLARGNPRAWVEGNVIKGYQTVRGYMPYIHGDTPAACRKALDSLVKMARTVQSARSNLAALTVGVDYRGGRPHKSRSAKLWRLVGSSEKTLEQATERYKRSCLI